MSTKEEVLKKVAEAVIVGDSEAALNWSKKAIEIGLKPYDVIIEGLAEGMKVVGDKMEAQEYFIPEVLLSADAMYAGLNYLLSLIPKEEKTSKGKVVMGVVEGDVHDIGKNIVKAMLSAAGYEVIDLGRDVKTDLFVEAAEKEGAQVIAMSTLMTPTLMSMKAVEETLKTKGVKDKVKTIVGGGAVSDDFAKSIGSDAYGRDALEAVDKVKLLLDQIRGAIEIMKKEANK
jgi:corrinoid protein of di/trimethylamine methyltransferase